MPTQWADIGILYVKASVQNRLFPSSFPKETSLGQSFSMPVLVQLSAPPSSFSTHWAIWAPLALWKHHSSTNSTETGSYAKIEETRQSHHFIFRRLTRSLAKTHFPEQASGKLVSQHSGDKKHTKPGSGQPEHCWAGPGPFATMSAFKKSCVNTSNRSRALRQHPKWHKILRFWQGEF